MIRRTAGPSHRVSAAAAALLLAAVVGSVPAAPRTEILPPGPVLSRWETAAPGNELSRDCGYSTPLTGTPRRSLWLFCDSVWKGDPSGLWLGVTAAIGPYTPGERPADLTEVPTPPAQIQTPGDHPPQGLLPVPRGVTLPDTGTECRVSDQAYAASWVSGVARIPRGAGDSAGRLLLTYTDVCVQPAAPIRITPQRYGVVEYDPSRNELSGQKTVFATTGQLPYQQVLGAPVFSGGYLYLVGFGCGTVSYGHCKDGKVTLARVGAHPDAWQHAAPYKYWTGEGWSADLQAAQSILPGARPLGAHAENFSAVGKGYVIVEQTDITGGFRIWRSDSLTGGWTLTRTGKAPCGDQSGVDLCRAYFGHPSLSTEDELMISYYDPTDDHVNVMAVPW